MLGVIEDVYNELKEKYDECRKEFIEYCDDRWWKRYWYESWEHFLDNAEPDGDDWGSTVWEQWYLKWLEDALAIIQKEV